MKRTRKIMVVLKLCEAFIILILPYFQELTSDFQRYNEKHLTQSRGEHGGRVYHAFLSRLQEKSLFRATLSLMFVSKLSFMLLINDLPAEVGFLRVL
ncbi:MAG: hypothetical protein LBU66_01350, partial [Treponema sp.]|nr:hypothetical protein [Treponema sp.]